MYRSGRKGMMSGIKLKSLKTNRKLVAISMAFLCKLVGTATAYEETKYELIKSTAVYEIRKYGDRLAVQIIQTSVKTKLLGHCLVIFQGQIKVHLK